MGKQFCGLGRRFSVKHGMYAYIYAYIISGRLIICLIQPSLLFHTLLSYVVWVENLNINDYLQSNIKAMDNLSYVYVLPTTSVNLITFVTLGKFTHKSLFHAYKNYVSLLSNLHASTCNCIYVECMLNNCYYVYTAIYADYSMC